MAAERTAVVTGASGYIAKHVVARLLAAGWRVRGTLRRLERAEEVRAAVAPPVGDGEALAERLGFVAADLLTEGGWEVALAGADALVHMASPFPMEQPKDADDLIRPAVEGTRRALGAAAAAGVRRVVLTSSVAAVINRPLAPGKTAYDEEDWTDPDDPRATFYDRSKTLAERAAWEEAGRHGLALTTINPGLVLGAPLDHRHGTSLAIIARLLAGKDPMVPDFGFPVVDVGDVAEMHLRALERPESAGERIIGAERYLRFPEMAAILKAAHPERRIATRIAPKPLLRVLALFDPSLRTILPIIGERREASAAKAERLLGMRFRDARQSLRETGAFLVRAA
jgi:dihydroflavonol-4-reductase